MPTYTVLDETTNKKVTFEWSGSKPPTDEDMAGVFAAAAKTPPKQPPQQQRPNGAVQTMQNIGRGYPVAETAANLATSAYGIPISGIVGLHRFPLAQTGQARI